MRSPEQIEELLDKLESMYNAYSDADAKYLDDQDAKSWSDRYGERLGAYSDKLKKLNGDDFDILEASRKEHKDSYSDLSDDEYINALEGNIKKTLERIWPEEPEKVEQAVNEITESESEEPEEEEPSETTVTVETTDEDSLDDFTKDLEDFKQTMPKRKE